MSEMTNDQILHKIPRRDKFFKQLVLELGETLSNHEIVKLFSYLSQVSIVSNKFFAFYGVEFKKPTIGMRNYPSFKKVVSSIYEIAVKAFPLLVTNRYAAIFNAVKNMRHGYDKSRFECSFQWLNTFMKENGANFSLCSPNESKHRSIYETLQIAKNFRFLSGFFEGEKFEEDYCEMRHFSALTQAMFKREIFSNTSQRRRSFIFESTKYFL